MQKALNRVKYSMTDGKDTQKEASAQVTRRDFLKGIAATFATVMAGCSKTQEKTNTGIAATSAEVEVNGPGKVTGGASAGKETPAQRKARIASDPENARVNKMLQDYKNGEFKMRNANMPAPTIQRSGQNFTIRGDLSRGQIGYEAFFRYMLEVATLKNIAPNDVEFFLQRAMDHRMTSDSREVLLASERQKLPLSTAHILGGTVAGMTLENPRIQNFVEVDIHDEEFNVVKMYDIAQRSAKNPVTSNEMRYHREEAQWHSLIKFLTDMERGVTKPQGQSSRGQDDVGRMIW